MRWYSVALSLSVGLERDQKGTVSETSVIEFELTQIECYCSEGGLCEKFSRERRGMDFGVMENEGL